MFCPHGIRLNLYMIYVNIIKSNIHVFYCIAGYSRENQVLTREINLRESSSSKAFNVVKKPHRHALSTEKRK